MKNIQIKTLLIFLFTMTVTISCTEDFNETPNEKENISSRNSGKALMEIAFEMTTSRDYDVIPVKISDLDLSTLNPSNEKQYVTMELFESGQMNITIEERDFKQKTRNPHKILPDTSPKIVKTVISGNSISFYDKNSKLLNTESIPIPNHIETVNKIKEIGAKFSAEDLSRTIATMQGQQFIDNLEEFIKDAPKNGVQVMEQGKNYVTLRISYKQLDPRVKEETVLLIDKRLNKMVGTRIYSENNELLQSTFFGYSKGEVKSLNAIKIEQKIRLPSGKSIKMITNSKIDNLTFNLNI